MVTARFRVSRVTPLGAETIEEGWGAEIEMTPDYAGGANHEWSEATPSGVCRLTVTNKAAVEKLPQGAALEIQFHLLDAN